MTGALLTRDAADAAVRASAARGFLDGRALAEVFAWLRPNDLVWNYWVTPTCSARRPSRSTCCTGTPTAPGLAGRLHRDFVHLAQRNGLTEPDGVVMLGSAVNLSQVTVDTYITAGISDHLCPWQNCYASTQLFGGTSRFVLSTSGHIASIVNPPGNKKAHFRTSEHTPPDPADWLAGAQTVEGSWWPDFSGWLHARTGDLLAAPKTPGSDDHPPIEAAPGSYVFVR